MGQGLNYEDTQPGDRVRYRGPEDRGLGDGEEVTIKDKGLLWGSDCKRVSEAPTAPFPKPDGFPVDVEKDNGEVVEGIPAKFFDFVPKQT